VARVIVGADEPERLSRILMRLQTHGVNRVVPGEAELRPALRDGVFLDDFSSTTNLDTQIHLRGRWIDVTNSEMDCGVVVIETPAGPGARTVAMSDVTAGALIVCGAGGVRVLPLPQAGEVAGGSDAFQFMSSAVSSEKPQALLVRQVADQMREVKARGEKIPFPIVARILLDSLEGLHAAHELKDDAGNPLGLVHRDFSPQNILIGIDGVTKLADFSVAKTADRVVRTHTGLVKGKIGYM
jgi:hypothetical protein